MAGEQPLIACVRLSIQEQNPLPRRWPLVLLPLHIVFVELNIDPACSTAFEAETEEENIMERPPARADTVG